MHFSAFLIMQLRTTLSVFVASQYVVLQRSAGGGVRTSKTSCGFAADYHYCRLCITRSTFCDHHSRGLGLQNVSVKTSGIGAASLSQTTHQVISVEELDKYKLINSNEFNVITLS